MSDDDDLDFSTTDADQLKLIRRLALNLAQEQLANNRRLATRIRRGLIWSFVKAHIEHVKIRKAAVDDAAKYYKVSKRTIEQALADEAIIHGRTVDEAAAEAATEAIGEMLQ